MAASPESLPAGSQPFDTRAAADRTASAMRGFVGEFGRVAATYLESCIHCGMCAEACHFYEATQDPKYTPIWKAEPFKQAYKREYGPFAPFYRAFGLKRPVTSDQLADWQELIYDSCTLCGRCSLICPMGIDITALILQARQGMHAAGLAPPPLQQSAGASTTQGAAVGASPAEFVALVQRLSREHAVDIPLDRPQADVVCTVSSAELQRYPEALVALARVMNHVGARWTLCSGGFEASNAALVAGDLRGQAQATLRLIDAAVACGAQVVVMPECGHAYTALRWMGAEAWGKPLPFAVLHLSEYLADAVRSGALRLRRLERRVTFHDPCQVSRRGGAIEAPRVVLEALGVELREMEPTRGTNWCCGGGGGVIANPRADALRRRAFHIKMEQVEATGAEFPVVSCATCRQTFDDGAARHHWDKQARNLLELVAGQLDTAAARPAAAG